MMTTQPDLRTPAPDTTQPLKRRGLLAAGVALVAGLVAKLTEQPVSAGMDGDVVLGAVNTTTGETIINNTSADNAALSVSCVGGTVGGDCSPTGVNSASSDRAVGTQLRQGSLVTQTETPLAFWASTPVVSLSAAPARAAMGSWARALLACPSSGRSRLAALPIRSRSTRSITLRTKGPGPGAGGFGSTDSAPMDMACVGATATAGGSAVVGATNGVAGAYAGVFYGPVLVGGAFTVVGGAKSAAVPHPDGSHRRLYCMESPESWFEDFGTGHLECGRAEIAIDPDFAALVRLDDYHVFLTQYDQHNDLCRDPDRTRHRLPGLKRRDAAARGCVRLARRRETEGHRGRPAGDRHDSAGTHPAGRAGYSDTDATDAASPAVTGGPDHRRVVRYRGMLLADEAHVLTIIGSGGWR